VSSIRRRGRVWHYIWRDEEGRQREKSLHTREKIVAEIRKGDEDRKRQFGSEGLADPKTSWMTAKREFLAGYRDGDRIKELHQQTLSMFEYQVRPVLVSSVTYSVAKTFRDHLQNHVSPKTGKTYAANTVNIHLRNLHTFFNEMKRSRYVAENPFENVRQLPTVKAAPRYLTKEQVAALISEARRSWPNDKVVMLMVFLYTGFRLSEVVNLKWSSVDLERELLYLRGSETWAPKDKEEHAIGLHPALLAGFRSLTRASEYVFPGSNGRRCRFSMVRLFNRLYNRCGIKDRGLHILRHTFATFSGLPIKVLQQVLGHSDIKTTMRYSHVTPEEMRMVKQISYE
jgi:integrase